MHYKLKFLLAASLFIGSFALAEENPPVHAILPTVVPGDSELVWNKWETKNFIILSLDKSQGLRLKNDADRIFSEALSRWGVEGGLPAQCKLVCVPDKQVLKRLFGMDAPRSEVRRDADGKVSVNAIWIDFGSVGSLSSLMSSAYLSSSDLGFFVQRGVLRLSSPASKIKSEITGLGGFSSKEVFSMSRDKWSSMKAEDRESFDRKAELVCLLLRREMGKRRFSDFLNVGKQDEQSLRSVYGFDGFAGFDATLKRYSENITKDASDGLLPDEYLTAR